MFFNFIDELRAAGIKASFKEHLTLLEALDRDVIEQTPEAFYYLSRATFVKDEGLLDRFDQVFNKVFKGLLTDYGQQPVDIPEDWLKAIAERFFSEEEMAKIKALGSWDEIMETLKHLRDLLVQYLQFCILCLVILTLLVGYFSSVHRTK